MNEITNNLQQVQFGAVLSDDGARFSVYSENAQATWVCLFDADGMETDRIPLMREANGVWSAHVSGIVEGQLYGLRAGGLYAPHDGHRFNEAKLLIDPYARQLVGSVTPDPALHSENNQDSARFVPKCVVTAGASDFDWGDDRPPNTPWDQTVIYEAHVKGLTQCHPAIPSQERGTFSALSHPAVIEHLRHLGVTAVELLPVHAFADDTFLIRRGLRNYWGYNTVNFFTPDNRYVQGFAGDALRDAIRALHAAGIEVFLDLVYNHTAESDVDGPTLSFRGLDNASYYALEAGNRSLYVNDTGCGNTLNTRHPMVIRLILDSLRYWAQSYRIDGFRFDLATVLGRTENGFDPHASLLSAIADDPVLSKLKLIAEPWDIGPDGYQLGNYSHAFAEWNDRFRDDVRRFWRGDEGGAPALATRIMGSADIFDRDGRPSYGSLNFITAHDGFTLTDLATFAEKHNFANGEENRDGHHENFSDNHGVEGATNDPVVLAAREKRRRNLLASLLISQGTPMILGGDELGNSQQGNNNAYCQDNELSWLDWTNVDTEFLEFARRVVALRNAQPALRQPAFLHGEMVSEVGLPNVEWRAFEGEHLDWDDPSMSRMAVVLRAPGSPSVAIAINNGADMGRIVLPKAGATNERWRGALDTSVPSGAFSDGFGAGDVVDVNPHALVVFVTEEYDGG